MNQLSNNEMKSKRFEAIAEGLQQGLMTLDGDGRILGFNPATRARLQGVDLQGADFLDRVAEGDLSRARGAFQSAWNEGQTQSAGAVYWKESSGEHILVDLTFCPVKAGKKVIEICLLIAFPSPLLESLKHQEASIDRLQSLIIGIPDVLFTTNQEGSIEFWNESATELTGFPASEMQGKSWQSVLKVREAASGSQNEDLPKMMNRECEVVTQDGRRLNVLVSSASMLGPDADPIGSLTVLKDISPIKDLQDRLRQKQQQLQEANWRLEELDQHRSQFLTHVSHELRTPLNSIIGFSSILLEEIIGPLNEEQKKQLDLVHRQAQQLVGQINDLLDAARMESKRLALDCRAFAVEEVIDEVVDTLTPLARDKQLSLIFDRPPLPVPKVYADARRVQQVLMNLVGNAVKFTHQGEVRIQCGQPRENPSYVEVRVLDTGPGIQAAEQERIFEEFEQVQGAEDLGTGLGLAIAKQLVEVQGGTIGAESRPEGGALFRFTLPVYAEEKDTAEAFSMIEAPVVVVTREAPLAGTLSTVLEGWGVRSIWWKQPEQIEKILQQGAEYGRLPQVLIVDEPMWSRVQALLNKLDERTSERPGCLVLSLEKEGADLDEQRMIFCRKPVSQDQLRTFLGAFMEFEGAGVKVKP